MSDSAADDRKRKLQEMRAKAQKKAVTQQDVVTETASPNAVIKEPLDEPTEKKIKFRNYQPYDSSLKKPAKTESAKENTTITEINVPVPPELVETDVIKQELEKFQDSELNIMPKKPNWDLKVQVEGKLLKLKNRTQKAIVEILREKLAAENADDEQK